MAKSVGCDGRAEVAECADKGHLMPILISADEAESPQGTRGQGEAARRNLVSPEWMAVATDRDVWKQWSTNGLIIRRPDADADLANKTMRFFWPLSRNSGYFITSLDVDRATDLFFFECATQEEPSSVRPPFVWNYKKRRPSCWRQVCFSLNICAAVCFCFFR